MATTGSKLINTSDAELVRLASDGEQAAFLVLYDRYKTGVTMHVGQFIPVREEVEDVVLESFQKAFSQIGSYNPQFHFSTWLFRIARNTAFDHIDKNGRVASNMPTGSIDDASAGLAEIAALSGNPEIEVIRSQEYDKLVRAIEGLSVTYRDVARMALLENYGYQEIADAMDMPLGTVKTRIKRAKDNILKVISSEEEDEI